MTLGHVFYIPAVALAALIVGFIWGRRAALQEFEAHQRLAHEREREREARREARRAARAGRDADQASDG